MCVCVRESVRVYLIQNECWRHCVAGIESQLERGRHGNGGGNHLFHQDGELQIETLS